MPDFHKVKILAPQTAGGDPADIVASADGALKVYDAAPVYMQGGIFVFEAAKAVTQGTTVYLANLMDADQAQQLSLMLRAVSQTPAEPIDALFALQQSPDLGITWYPVYLADGTTPVSYTLQSTGSANTVYKAISPIHISGGLIRIAVTATRPSGSSAGATVYAHAGWRP